MSRPLNPNHSLNANRKPAAPRHSEPTIRFPQAKLTVASTHSMNPHIVDPPFVVSVATITKGIVSQVGEYVKSVSNRFGGITVLS